MNRNRLIKTQFRKWPIFLLGITFLFSSCQQLPSNAPQAEGQTQPKISEPISAVSDPQLTFGQHVGDWIEKVFPEYEQAEGDPMDAYPKYKTAKASLFSTLRRTNPISNRFGKAVYPRILLKTYQFEDEASLRMEIEAWLNGMQSSITDIKLGQIVTDLKSPLSLCAVLGTEFWVAQSGCVYDGKDWDITERRFFDFMRAEDAIYTFKIDCQGKINYFKSPRN